MKIKELEKYLNNIIKEEIFDYTSGLWNGVSIHTINTVHIFYHDRGLGFWEGFYDIEADHCEEVEEEKGKFKIICSGLKTAIEYTEDDGRTSELDIYVSSSEEEKDFTKEEITEFIQAIMDSVDFFEDEKEEFFRKKYGLSK